MGLLSAFSRSPGFSPLGGASGGGMTNQAAPLTAPSGMGALSDFMAQMPQGGGAGGWIKPPPSRQLYTPPTGGGGLDPGFGSSPLRDMPMGINVSNPTIMFPGVTRSGSEPVGGGATAGAATLGVTSAGFRAAEIVNRKMRQY